MQLIHMSSSHKITATQTGTLFYTKIGESTGRYRVRFRSFQQAQLENREVQDQLEQLHANYKYFKYGKSQSHKGSLQLVPNRQPIPKLNKNLKDRLKDGVDMKNRLKSMESTRLSLFERIKSLKE